MGEINYGDEFHKLEEELKSTGNPEEYSVLLTNFAEWMKKCPEKEYQEWGLVVLVDIVQDKKRDINTRFLILEILKELGSMGPDRMNNLGRICSDEEEPLRLRWAAIDLLGAFLPSIAENYKGGSHAEVLFNRSVDPDNPPPKFDIEEAKEINRKKENARFKYYIMTPPGIFIAVMGAYFAWNTPYFWPFVFGFFGLTAFLLIWVILSIRRCPKCRRFFAREKLEFVGRSQGASYVSSGNTTVTTLNIDTYRTKCRYCNHEWIVTR